MPKQVFLIVVILMLAERVYSVNLEMMKLNVPLSSEPWREPQPRLASVSFLARTSRRR